MAVLVGFVDVVDFYESVQFFLTAIWLFLQLIGWQKKEDALRMMLIVTDAGYHFAGDGLVGLHYFEA